MMNVLKKYGLIGGTAAACAACCAAPLFMGPLVAWTGATALGLAFSPWFLLLLAVPGLLMFARKMGKQTPKPSPAVAGACGWARLLRLTKGKSKDASKPAPIAWTRTRNWSADFPPDRDAQQLDEDIADLNASLAPLTRRSFPS